MKKIFNKLFKKRKKGFTLIEILVVIIILGVLVGIAVPTYNKLIRKSRVSDGLHGLDVLAGAQEKYFIAHGFYAQNLKSLNAPFKEYRTDEHNDIFTTNFTYTKPSNRSCIEAQSNRDDYKLVKNYRTKEKVVCIGDFCDNISDYVTEISEEGYSLLCQIDNNNGNGNCNLTEDDCNENEYLDISLCKCFPLGSGGDNCTPCVPEQFSTISWMQGSCSQIYTGIDYSKTNISPQGNLTEQKESCGTYKYIQTCEPNSQGQYCITTNRTCEPKNCELLYGEGWHLAGPGVPNHNKCDCIKDCPQPQPSVSSVCPTHTLSDCNKQVCDPCSTTVTYIHGNDRSGGSMLEDSCCGLQSPEHNRVECNYSTGEWACVNDQDPCERVEVPGVGEDCDGTDQHPEATVGNTCGIKKLGQCKLDHFCEIISNTSCVLKSGNQCFDGQTRTCTLTNGTQGIEHCVECKWDNNCVENPCTDPQPASQDDECGTTSYICEQDGTGNWNWVNHFTPFEGNECQNGDTTTEGCPEGQHKTCENCHWSDCHGGENCDGIPMLQEMFVPNTESCLKYNQECIKNEETNAWEWQYTTTTWVNDYGQDQNCITGSISSCPSRSGGRGGGNGGAKGMVNPCCDLACQDSCRVSCNEQISDETIYQQCTNRCIEDNGGRCQGGNDIGGYGSNPGNYCPAQYCPSGYYWNMSTCNCLPYNPGSGNDPSLYKHCIDCHWSECEHCPQSTKPQDEECVRYVCEGSDDWGWNWEQELIGTCRPGQYRDCENGQGRQWCDANTCDWGGCVLAPYTVSNINVIVNSFGNVYYCPQGINTQNMTEDTSVCNLGLGIYTYITCNPSETSSCVNEQGISLQRCDTTDRWQYCRSHGAGSMCIISGDMSACPESDCWERQCPGPDYPYWQDQPASGQRSCSRSFQILRCN